jgi:hypothetical protein
LSSLRRQRWKDHGSTQSFEPYTISSMVRLDWLSPDSTNPAYRIQGADDRPYSARRIAR